MRCGQGADDVPLEIRVGLVSKGPSQPSSQHHDRGDVSLLKGQGDWLPLVWLDLETYGGSVVGAEMPSQWHQEAQ